MNAVTLQRRAVLLGLAAGVGLNPMARAFASSEAGITPAAALARLQAGNARFVSGRVQHGHDYKRQRAASAETQKPFAAVLTCADSRLAPELLFDQGLGDLFVVRVAGNIVDSAVVGSLEYAVIHLGTPLIMVVGHERCGAVKATVDALAGVPAREDRDTSIGFLADLIAPAVRATPKNSKNLLEASIVQNALNSARVLAERSRPLQARVSSGSLRITASYYDLDDGVVRLLG